MKWFIQKWRVLNKICFSSKQIQVDTLEETVLIDPYVPGIVSIEIMATTPNNNNWFVKDVSAKVCYEPGMWTDRFVIFWVSKHYNMQND